MNTSPSSTRRAWGALAFALVAALGPGCAASAPDQGAGGANLGGSGGGSGGIVVATGGFDGGLAGGGAHIASGGLAGGGAGGAGAGIATGGAAGTASGGAPSGGAAGAGTGGASGAGTGGASGGTGGASGGTGGGATGGSGGATITKPATCEQSHGTVGCCTPSGGLYWWECGKLQGGENYCQGKPCGWDPARKWYACGGSGVDPSGVHPRLCGEKQAPFTGCPGTACCAGNCGKSSSPSGCACDFLCGLLGDCCLDACSACGIC